MRKYYDLKNLLKAGADINIIDGAREMGKSWAVCEYALTRSYKTYGKEGGIAYLRRKDKQMRTIDVESYVKDSLVEKVTHGEYSTIVVKRGMGYFASPRGIDAEGKAVWALSDYPVIKGFAVTNADDYKSLNFTFDTAIYEEYQTIDGYLQDEPEKLMSIYSTLKRGCPERFKMFLVANTICRINPYVNFFGMTNYNKQKKGTIDRYKLYTGLFDDEGNETFITIAREYSDLTADGKTAEEAEDLISKHDKRKRMSLMITRGDWQEAHLYPTMRYQDIQKLGTPEYVVYMLYENSAFKISWYWDNVMLFPYIVPHKMSVPEDARIISPDHIYLSPLFTKTFKPLSEGERVLFNTLKDHARFCDNLTGNEFFAALKNLC